MAISDRLWNILASGASLLLALVIIFFPESNEKNSVDRLIQEVDETFMPFTKPPNIFGANNLGELGFAVNLPVNLPPGIQKIVDEGWKKQGFNQYLSDLISVRRKLIDRRSSFCKANELKYNKNLPKTSVIMIFHNEAWSTLLRSVHSVLDRSPDHLIEEVLLVDDFSDMDHLKKPLDDYMENYPKVRILRGEKREGLVKARIRGTLAAKASILTFLESHIECSHGWLEPLLDRVSQNPLNVVCPVIDTINDETFEYKYVEDPRQLQIGSFTWHLTFKWQPIPENELLNRKDPSEPLVSPTLSGGLFSIDKAFFMKLGMYDPDFDIWGAENLELSFKTWMCGGNLVFLPCSHVGHIFRSKSPYKWSDKFDVLKRNMIRLAEVWMDEYAEYFYAMTGYKSENYGDISARVKLRQDLKCKPFKWFMDKFYLGHFNVSEALAIGKIRSFVNNNQSCLIMLSSAIQHPLQVIPCEQFTEGQYFFLTANGELRRDQLCLDFVRPRNTVMPFKCREEKGNQFWSFLSETSQIYHNKSSLCLSFDTTKNLVVMENCVANRVNQKWFFQRPGN